MIPAQTLALLREQAKRLMWDTCQLLPAIGTGRTITGAGVLIQTPPTPRTYNGSTNIPCRVDLARAFRPGELTYQTVAVDNDSLELPYDVLVEETDTVIIGANRYEIRKLQKAGAGDVSQEALIFRLGGVTLDNT